MSSKRQTVGVCAAVCVVLFLTFVSVSNAAVIGIDFGSEFIKVSIVKPGLPFHMVLDEMSKRKIPSIIAFTPEERLFGTAAITSLIRRPEVTYAFSNLLLGETTDSVFVDFLKSNYFPYQFIKDTQRNTVSMRLTTRSTSSQRTSRACCCSTWRSCQK